MLGCDECNRKTKESRERGKTRQILVFKGEVRLGLIEKINSGPREVRAWGPSLEHVRARGREEVVEMEKHVGLLRILRSWAGGTVGWAKCLGEGEERV